MNKNNFKQFVKKTKKTINVIKNYFKQLVNNTKKLFEKMKTIWKPTVTIAILCFLCSCGTTRATISKPAEGTVTTITITTNNPIETTPTIDLGK